MLIKVNNCYDRNDCVCCQLAMVHSKHGMSAPNTLTREVDMRCWKCGKETTTGDVTNNGLCGLCSVQPTSLAVFCMTCKRPLIHDQMGSCIEVYPCPDCTVNKPLTPSEV